MRKKDEMEQEIANKSIKVTWFATIIGLYIMAFIHHFTASGRNVYLTIATSSILFYIFLERFYFSKVTDKKSFFKFIGLVILLTVIMFTILIWTAR